MKRRTFIKGAVSAAVAASIPASACGYCGGVFGDHFTWCNDVNPLKYTHKTYAIATEGMDGQRMAKALAFSMRQTREIVAANVFNQAFGG